MDEDELLALAQSVKADPIAPPPRSGIAEKTPRRGTGLWRDLRDTGRALAQGATFGFADEVEAAVRAPFAERTYRELRDDIRGDNASFREEHPVAALSTEIAGGLATAKVSPAALRGLSALMGETLPGVTRAAAAAGRVASAPIRGGAALGGLAGVGYSDGDGVSFRDAVQGAAMGGAIGGGVRAVTAAPRIFQRAWQNVSGSPEAVERGARSVVRDQVARAGGDEAVERALRSLSGETDAARVMDALPKSSQRVVRGAVTRGGDVAQEIGDELAARRAGAYDRVEDAVKRGLHGDAVDVEHASQQIAEAASELADRSYGEVFARGTLVEGPDLVRLLKSPTVRKAWQRVAEIDRNFMAAGGKGRYRLDLGHVVDDSDGLFEAFLEHGRMDLQSADALKRGLDDVIKNGLDGVTPGGLRGEQKASVIALKNRLLDLADSADDMARREAVGLPGQGSSTALVPEGQAATPQGTSYREARKEFETAMRWRDALEEGGDLLSMPPAKLETVWGNLSPDEQAVALVGFRSKVLQQLGKGDMARDRTRGLLGSPDFHRKVRTMLGDHADGFLANLKAERSLADADRFVLGGSATADKLADAAGPSLAGVADAAFALRSPGAMGSYAFRKGLGAVDRLRGGTMGRVGDRAARELLRPADEVGDVLDWLARESRGWQDRAAEAGRSRYVAPAAGVAGGR